MPEELDELQVLDDDEFDEELDEGLEDSDDVDGVEPPDELALLKEEIASLRTQNAQQSKAVKDFSAAVGRYQSLIDKMEAGRGDTDKLARQLAASVGGVEQVIDTILADPNIDPEVRARALAARDSTKANAKLASLEAEIEALKNKPEPVQEVQSNELTVLERTVHTMINRSGLQIEDFNWTEANLVYSQTGSEAEIISYFTNKIAEKKAESTAAERRQARKASAGKPAPKGADNAGDIATQLENAKDLDEGVEMLRKLGVPTL
jgi:hypothetical protein